MLAASRRSTPRNQQGGAAIVEFALIAMFFFMLLIGIMEFGRWLFTLNAASEATRWGARLAVVCDNTEPQKEKIKKKIVSILHGVSDEQVDITYSPPGCASVTCITDVTVSMKQSAKFTAMIPFFSGSYQIPPFTVTLPRESMESVNKDGDINEVCN